MKTKGVLGEVGEVGRDLSFLVFVERPQFDWNEEPLEGFMQESDFYFKMTTLAAMRGMDYWKVSKQGDEFEDCSMSSSKRRWWYGGSAASVEM